MFCCCCIFICSCNAAVSGPKQDNPSCHGVCPDDIETVETINHNKILIVNEIGSTLITCGSVMQVSEAVYVYVYKKIVLFI